MQSNLRLQRLPGPLQGSHSIHGRQFAEDVRTTIASCWRIPIDAVFIITPEHLHYPMFMAALKAGKNIYVEKPLAHTIEEGAEMVKRRRKIRQGRAGRHAESQQFAIQEGQGDGASRA